jgi:ADP-heptose:LPS heptosyltransferase
MCSSLNLTHVIISQPSINQVYDEAMKKCARTTILNSDIRDVCEIISNSKLMIACDTGFRAVAWGYNVPVISLSKQCYAPGKVLPPQLIRWNPYDNLCFPLNHNTGEIISLAKRILDNKVYTLFPELSDWKTQLIRRNYNVNEEKSRLQ